MLVNGHFNLILALPIHHTGSHHVSVFGGGFKNGMFGVGLKQTSYTV